MGGDPELDGEGVWGERPERGRAHAGKVGPSGPNGVGALKDGLPPGALD